MERYYRQLLEDIQKLSLSIKVLYNNLYNLEINGLKESDEYKKVLDYLNIALDCERKVYSKISNEEKDSIIGYFKLLAFYYNDQDLVLDNLYSKDDEKLAIIRILSKLLGNNSKIRICKFEFDDQDFNSCLIKFINYFFVGKNSADIILKYSLSFMIPQIEKLNIISGFEDLKDVEVDDKTILKKRIKVKGKIIIKEDNNLEYLNRIKSALNILKSFSTDDLKNNQKWITYIFYLIYLRACMYYFSCYNGFDIIKIMIDNFIYRPEIIELNDSSLVFKSIRTTLSSFDSDKKYMDSKFYNLNNKQETKKSKN